jgi:ribonuclease R
MFTDFFIEQEELKDFEHGDKVVVHFKDWPKRASSPFGKIVKSLGKPGELNTEMHAIMFEYGFPDAFPLDVESIRPKLRFKNRP